MPAKPMSTCRGGPCVRPSGRQSHADKERLAMSVIARGVFTLIVVVGQLLLLLGPAPEQSSVRAAAETAAYSLGASAGARAPDPAPGPAGAANHTTIVE